MIEPKTLGERYRAIRFKIALEMTQDDHWLTSEELAILDERAATEFAADIIRLNNLHVKELEDQIEDLKSDRNYYMRRAEKYD